MAVWSLAQYSQLREAARADAEYFHPRYLRLAKQLSKFSCEELGNLGFVTDGIHSPPEVVEDGGMRYLTSKCTKNNEISLLDTYQISARHDQANKRTRLQTDDVLITVVGTIGNAAVVTSEVIPSNIDRDLGLVRLKADSTIDPFFLASFLNSQYGKFQMVRESTGNVQLHLFIEKMKKLRIPHLPCEKKVSHLTRQAYTCRKKGCDFFEEAEKILVSTLGLDKLDMTPSLCYQIPFSEMLAGYRFGAEYFQPPKLRVLAALRQMPGKPLHEHYRSVKDLFQPDQAKRGEMARNFDLTDALQPFLDDTVEPIAAREIGSTKKRIARGDVVISRLRSYLREIAIVRASGSPPSMCSTEFIVLRPRRDAISAGTLLTYLRSAPVQTILKWSQDGSNHPRFTEEDLLDIPVPAALEKVSKRVDDLVNQALDARQESAALLEKAKKAVEDMILEA